MILFQTDLRQWQETKCCQKQLEDKNVHLERENMVLESEKKSLESENKQLKREVWYLQQQLATFSQEIHSLRAAQQESIAFGIEPWKVGRDDVMLGRVIGGGGWGVVNQAKLQVAVKQFYPNILSERNLARLQREMRILALIRHPNLLQFIAAVFDENNEHEKNPPYIITELLDMSLRSAYEKNLLPRSSLLPVFMDTARALDYLHRRHEAIIHRDVSSANVLLKRHPNDKWVAKLSDLGSANLAQEAYTMNEGARVYLAPEAFTSSTDARSTGTLTPKVDVYSYGVVLCEVATSTFPEQAALSAMFVRVQREWHQLHRLIVACTNPDPTQRPSMASILSSLEQFPPK